MAKIDFRLFAHHSRNPDFVNDQLRQHGYEAEVFMDYTNHGVVGKKNMRMIHYGHHTGFREILEKPSDADWVIMLADDVELTSKFRDGVNAVMDNVPDYCDTLSIYAPTNKTYIEAHKAGHNILETWANVWMQGWAFRPEFGQVFGKWIDQWVIKGVCSEDGMFSRYNTITGHKTHSLIVPLIQHVGHYRSIYNYPATCGKYIRQSFAYRRNFDHTAIDWPAAWENRYMCGSKKYNREGIRDEPIPAEEGRKQ